MYPSRRRRNAFQQSHFTPKLALNAVFSRFWLMIESFCCSNSVTFQFVEIHRPRKNSALGVVNHKIVAPARAGCVQCQIGSWTPSVAFRTMSVSTTPGCNEKDRTFGASMRNSVRDLWKRLVCSYRNAQLPSNVHPRLCWRSTNSDTVRLQERCLTKCWQVCQPHRSSSAWNTWKQDIVLWGLRSRRGFITVSTQSSC